MTTPKSQKTSNDIPQPIWWTLPYVQGVSELIARHLWTYHLLITHKPTEFLRKALVHVRDPLHTQRQRTVVYSNPRSEGSSAYVDQIGRQFATHMEEHATDGLWLRAPAFPICSQGFIARVYNTRLLTSARQ